MRKVKFFQIAVSNGWVYGLTGEGEVYYRNVHDSSCKWRLVEPPELSDIQEVSAEKLATQKLLLDNQNVFRGAPSMGHEWKES